MNWLTRFIDGFKYVRWSRDPLRLCDSNTYEWWYKLYCESVTSTERSKLNWIGTNEYKLLSCIGISVGIYVRSPQLSWEVSTLIIKIRVEMYRTQQDFCPEIFSEFSYIIIFILVGFPNGSLLEKLSIFSIHRDKQNLSRVVCTNNAKAMRESYESRFESRAFDIRMFGRVWFISRSADLSSRAVWGCFSGASRCTYPNSICHAFPLRWNWSGRETSDRSSDTSARD